MASDRAREKCRGEEKILLFTRTRTENEKRTQKKQWTTQNEPYCLLLLLPTLFPSHKPLLEPKPRFYTLLAWYRFPLGIQDSLTDFIPHSWESLRESIEKSRFIQYCVLNSESESERGTYVSKTDLHDSLFIESDIWKLYSRIWFRSWNSWCDSDWIRLENYSRGVGGGVGVGVQLWETAKWE